MAASRPTKNFRLPPQNLESEKALLGSIMLRPELMHDAIEIVVPDAFYSEKHRIIWRTMFDLFSKSVPIDFVSVSSHLRERNQLEQIGGSVYIGELVNVVPSAANATHYANAVRNKHILRNLIAAADFISALGYDEAEEIEEILDRAEKKLFEITNFTTSHHYLELKETLAEAWERLDRLHKSKDVLRGVSTGFPELDNKLSGLQKSDLIILAARPSMGKTSLALDIARKTAIKNKVPTAIFSLE